MYKILVTLLCVVETSIGHDSDPATVKKLQEHFEVCSQTRRASDVNNNMRRRNEERRIPSAVI